MKAAKWLRYGSIILLLVILLFSSLTLVQAACEVKDYANPDDYQRAIEECQKEIDSRMEAHSKNKQDLAGLDKSLANTQKLITAAERQIDNLEAEIFAREVDREYQKKILAARVRSYYKKSHHYSPLLLLLASDNAIGLVRELAYRKIATDEDRETIVQISQDLKQLLVDKGEIEANKGWLEKTKAGVSQQAQGLRSEVEKVEGYFTEVSSKIAQLSAKQQALLSARAGTFITGVGEVPLADDPAARPDYDPGFRPAFAVFSFGAYTHRKGMSQYGALGRANSGQNAEQILAAYWPGSRLEKNYPVMGSITVQGYGTRNFEDQYMKRIYEVPASWPMEVLKAQAVAARTYAIRRTNNGATSICATQSCQVYKDANKGGAWDQAANETRGWVLVDGSGQPTSGYYSSTTGGYLLESGWDTTCGSSDCWTDGAYEKIAGSPWFYKGWYTQSYLNSSAKCGRGHPWLTETEMADILNAWLVRQRGGEAEVNRLLPVTINQCSVGGTTGNPFSIEELKATANGYGGAFTNVSSASVTYGNNGETNAVTFGTNKGSVTVSGAEFRQAFNLRAPGYIAIRTPLFNLEKK